MILQILVTKIWYSLSYGVRVLVDPVKETISREMCIWTSMCVPRDACFFRNFQQRLWSSWPFQLQVLLEFTSWVDRTKVKSIFFIEKKNAWATNCTTVFSISYLLYKGKAKPEITWYVSRRFWFHVPSQLEQREMEWLLQGSQQLNPELELTALSLCVWSSYHSNVLIFRCPIDPNNRKSNAKSLHIDCS